MARRLHLLNARAVTAVRNPLPPGKHADGGGLYLKIDPPLASGESGSKRWVFVYFWRNPGEENARHREMGLGSLKSVSLERARELAADARALVEAGTDPKSARDEARAAANAVPVEVVVVSFGAHARAYVEARKKSWRGKKTEARWTNAVENHCRRILASPIADIETSDVLDVLTPIWWKIPAMAQKTQSAIEAILDSAKALGLRSGDNPARWHGHLSSLLHERPKATRGPHAALPIVEIAAFLKTLRSRKELEARALEMVILTGARSGEVRGATWSEFDLESRLWLIPRNRLKECKVLERLKVAHKRVPLNKGAVTVLRDMRNRDDLAGDLLPDAHIFPGPLEGKTLNYDAMRKILRLMGVPVTVHGFRSTFRDWAAEQRIKLPSGRLVPLYSWDACEISLGHAVGNETSRAYFRGDLFDERRDLMDDWGDFCDGVERVAEPEAATNDNSALLMAFLSENPELAAQWMRFQLQRRAV